MCINMPQTSQRLSWILHTLSGTKLALNWYLAISWSNPSLSARLGNNTVQPAMLLGGFYCRIVHSNLLVCVLNFNVSSFWQYVTRLDCVLISPAVSLLCTIGPTLRSVFNRPPLKTWGILFLTFTQNADRFLFYDVCATWCLFKGWQRLQIMTWRSFGPDCYELLR